jgi:hypothetical protein
VANPEDYLVLISDKDLQIAGDPIVSWTTLDVTLKFNEPGAAITTVAAEPWIVEQLEAGARVDIIRAGEILISGPVEKWLLERSDNGENAGVGQLTINSTDDLAFVAARDTYPDPAHTPDAQTASQWTYTGNAETGIRNLVNANAGPGALVARRVPHMALAPAAGVGTSVTATADRQQPLLDVARAIATTGGDLGFRTRRDGSQIVFEVYAPPDKSGSVRFSFGLGNLKYFSYEQDAPTATVVTAGGQGDTLADQAMIERTNATELASWGRFEKHVARPGTDPTAELQDAADQALGEGAATVRITTSTADTPDQQYGVHYHLGDKVAIETFPGQQIADVVRTVHLQVYATSGEVVAAYVGSQAALTDPMWVKRLRDIEARLGRVEMTVVPA